MTKEQIASLIMDAFKERNSKPDHVLDEKWLRINLFDKLNPKEQQLVDAAVQDLVNSKLITIANRSGMNCLVLTEAGYDHIYPIDKAKTRQKIGKAILSAFAKQNSKPNHTLDQRWINFNLVKGLNPKEIDLLDASIMDLVNQGLITTDTTTALGYCLVLTEKGFDSIY